MKNYYLCYAKHPETDEFHQFSWLKRLSVRRRLHKYNFATGQQPPPVLPGPRGSKSPGFELYWQKSNYRQELARKWS